MASKIFKAVFFTAMSVLIAALSVTVIILCCYDREFCTRIFYAVLLFDAAILIFTLPIAYLVSKKTAESIARQINRTDLENISDSGIYAELRPLSEKITVQNYKLSRQLSELKMRKNEFDLMTNNMNEGMILLNSRGAVLSCNRSAKRIFGIGADVPSRIFGISSSSEFKDAITNALSGRAENHSFRSGDRCYHMTVNPVFHEGRIEGAVMVVIDDTEKEEREGLRREFTSNVSHELKTPLTSISGFAELISTGMAEGEDAKKFAGNIHKEAKRLISLVGDIIRLTQLDGGEIPYDGEIDMYSASKDVTERLLPIAERAEVELVLEGESAMVLGNITILEEMIFNLCDNAIKYNHRGGQVRVSVRNESGCASVTVSDNGIGIPKDKQDRVFERFYRVDKSHSKDIGGTGLGLSIVKHAANYHKAKIELESELGVGTTVKIIFPQK